MINIGGEGCPHRMEPLSAIEGGYERVGREVLYRK